MTATPHLAAAAIAAATTKPGPVVAFRQAKVSVVNADGTLQLTWPTGGTVDNVPRMSGYRLPSVDDVVTVLLFGSNIVSPVVVDSVTAGVTPRWKISGGNGTSIANGSYPGVQYVGSSTDVNQGLTSISSGTVTVARAGRYVVSFGFELDHGTSTEAGVRLARIEQWRSGSLIAFRENAYQVPSGDADVDTRVSTSMTFDAAAADQFKALIYQTSGVGLHLKHGGNYGYCSFEGIWSSE